MSEQFNLLRFCVVVVWNFERRMFHSRMRVAYNEFGKGLGTGWGLGFWVSKIVVVLGGSGGQKRGSDVRPFFEKRHKIGSYQGGLGVEMGSKRKVTK